MSESYSRLARDRLQQLSATLTTLRERVREAVASEMSKAVGEALRDLLTAILNRNAARSMTPPVQLVAPQHTPPSSRWEDDDPEWYDELPSATPPRVAEPYRPHLTPPKSNAIRLGFDLTRWLLQRRVPLIAGLGVGLAAGLAALSNNSLVQTGLAVIVAASELLAITEYATKSP